MACSLGFLPHEIFQRRAKMTPPPPPPEPEPEPKVSDFDPICVLGQGGFARVTKVRHRRTRDVFALKEAFYPSPFDVVEAAVLRRAAGSPFVVRCHATFPGRGGELVSVLEYMDAGSLLDVLRRSEEQGFPEPVLAEVAARCLMGLDHLHVRGIAHLDVKPENVLADSRGHVKINDFNTSRIVVGRFGDRYKVRTDTGTAAYFSPERFAPNEADAEVAMAADVWGLGLTIVELFWGQEVIVPEAKEPKMKDWLQAICNNEPPSVPECPWASAELRDFVAACLQKDPNRRPTVQQLLQHPFVTRRDVVVSSRALRELILKNL